MTTNDPTCKSSAKNMTGLSAAAASARSSVPNRERRMASSGSVADGGSARARAEAEEGGDAPGEDTAPDGTECGGEVCARPAGGGAGAPEGRRGGRKLRDGGDGTVAVRGILISVAAFCRGAVERANGECVEVVIERGGQGRERLGTDL